jgi:cytochrome c
MTPRFVFALAALFCATAAVADPPSGDIQGRRLFLRCASCHDITAGPSAKIGPSLHGVFGRPVASLPGYGYSPALKSKTFVWDAAMLDRWLTKPDDVAPGTSMAFSGLSAPDDRQALIAYLAKATK